MFSARPPSPAGTDALARLSWHDFEHLLAEHYRDQGWLVEYHETPKSLKHLEGALDLRLHRGNETVIVQCKHWDAAEVQLHEVNELLGTMLNEAVTRGVLITRGKFSAEARAAQRRQPRLQLVDGDVLRVMLKLPDHLDTSIPGIALPTVAARKAARPRRASDRGMGSRWLPLLLVAAIALLLGFFVWRAMSRHAEPVVAPPAGDAAAASAPAAAKPAPQAPLPPPAAAPASPEPSISKELQERARLREAEPKPAHDARRPSEDAMKVMERNTREVGSAD